MIEAWVAPILNRLKGIKTKNDEILSVVNEVKSKQDSLQDVVAKESSVQELATGVGTINMLVNRGECLQGLNVTCQSFFKLNGNASDMVFDDNYYYTSFGGAVLYVYSRGTNQLIASINKSTGTSPFTSIYSYPEYVVCRYGGDTTIISKKTWSIVYSGTLGDGHGFYDLLVRPSNPNHLLVSYGSKYNYCVLSYLDLSTQTESVIYNASTYQERDVVNCIASTRLLSDGAFVYTIGRDSSYKFDITKKNKEVFPVTISHTNRNTFMPINNDIIVCRNNSILKYNTAYTLLKKISFNASFVPTSLLYLNGHIIAISQQACVVLNSQLTRVIKYYAGNEYQYCDGEYVYISANGGFELTALTECNIAV